MEDPGELSDLPFYLKVDHKLSPEKDALSVSGREEQSYHQKLGSDAKNRPVKQTC